MNFIPETNPGFMFQQIFSGSKGIWVILLAFWSLFWMGWSLWTAAKNKNKVWFIILLLVHTMGILDILYIFIFSKISETKKVKLAKK